MSPVVGLFKGSKVPDVSRETSERLTEFVALLTKWNERINLVSRTSVPEIWSRHIMDSIQVYHAARVRTGHWVDLGTGGGFPGLICAILASGENVPLTFALIESNKRKAAFLQIAIQQLGLTARVFPQRIETVAPQAGQILTARALSSLSDLMPHAERHLDPEGLAIFPKGANAEAEILAAQSHWRFKLERIPSITDATAMLLRIGEIRRA